MQQLNSHMFEEVYKTLGIDLDTLGCIMLDVLPPGNQTINPDWLYYTKDKKKFWINGYVFSNTAHMTLLYGLLKSGQAWKREVETVLKGWNLKSVTIEDVGFFNSPYKDEPYYCIVGHVKVTDELMEGHRRLEFLPHINTFAGYKPHITIAYVKKDDAIRDTAIKHFKDELVNKTLEVKEINFGK